MRVAVLGAGNGGCATAFDWAQHGHEVRLWSPPGFDQAIAGIREAGGLTSTGDLEGTVELAWVGTDIAAAVAGADLVFVVGPAYSTEPIARAVGPHLTPDMTVVLNPGSCGGAIAFRRALDLPADAPGPLVGETSTLPYAVRLTGPASLTVYLKLRAGLYVATLPRQRAAGLAEVLGEVWPGIEPASSVFQTTLQNGNPVIHPAVTLLNAGLVERTRGDFLFYEQGVTPGVGRLIEGVDAERLAIARALGVPVLSEPGVGVLQGYMTDENYSTGYSEAPGFLGIKAQRDLDHRYLTEDIGYGLVLLTDLGRALGVPTPTMDAVIQLGSVVLGRDFRAEGARTLAGLGLAGLTASELIAL